MALAMTFIILRRMHLQLTRYLFCSNDDEQYLVAKKGSNYSEYRTVNFLFTFSTFSKFIDIALGCFYVSKKNYGSTANLSIFQNSFLGRFYFGKNEVDILRRPLKFDEISRFHLKLLNHFILTLLDYFCYLTSFQRYPYKNFVGFLVNLKPPKGRFEIESGIIKFRFRHFFVAFSECMNCICKKTLQTFSSTVYYCTAAPLL